MAMSQSSLVDLTRISQEDGWSAGLFVGERLGHLTEGKNSSPRNQAKVVLELKSGARCVKGEEEKR